MAVSLLTLTVVNVILSRSLSMMGSPHPDNLRRFSVSDGAKLYPHRFTTSSSYGRSTYVGRRESLAVRPPRRRGRGAHRTVARHLARARTDPARRLARRRRAHHRRGGRR